MTLADILKPSLTVIVHAQTKGVQLGATLATLAAIPTIVIRPAWINPNQDPPLVAIANIAGLGAATGLALVSLPCAYKMSKLSREGIIQRAEKILANVDQQSIDRASRIGATVGLGLVGVRVFSIAKNEGRCIYGLLFRRQTAWECFGFCSMGAAIGAGLFILANKIYARKHQKQIQDDVDKVNM